MQRKIQQQYFTRDREGIFRTSEGFDTVAKSPSLDNMFIKTVLHPYCVYKAPQELLAQGESDSRKYPESFLVFHADNGDLVIGRSVYLASDFTGQRSASFTHQFVIPRERKESYVQEPERLFHMEGFQSAYDIRQGKALPELEETGYDSSSRITNPDQLLQELGVDAKLFQQLLHAVMSSVTNKKKVYIALDTEVSAIADTAKSLMEIVYSSIPFAIRRQLGFMTYHSEPESKHNVHVVFVEKGSLRLPDRRIDKDYIFDLPNERYINAELPGSDAFYFELIWELRHDLEQQRRLFEFCDEALQGLPAHTSLLIASYVSLAKLYAVEQGDMALYKQDKPQTLQHVLSYLTEGTIQHKRRLKELLILLIRKEASDSGDVPQTPFIRSMLEYYPYAEGGEKAFLIQCFVVFIHRVSSSGEGSLQQAVHIFDELIAQQPVFAAVMKSLHQQSARTVEQYAAYRIGKVSSVDGLQKEISFWLSHAVELVFVRFFSNELLKKLKLLLESRDLSKRIELIGGLHRFLDSLDEHYKVPQLQDFVDQLKLELQLELLGELELEALSYEDVSRLRFMVDPIAPELIQHMSKSSRQTLILLGILYRTLTLAPEEEADALEAFRGLGPLELDKVQAALQRILAERLDSSRFRALTYAFYQPDSDRERGFGSSEYNYDRMLEYLAARSSEEGIVFAFLLWSASDERFLDLKGVMHPNYRSAVSKFFDRHAPAAFRQKAVSEQLLAVSNPSFASLFQSIKLKQAPVWIRLLVKNKRKLIRSGIIIVPVFILLLVLLWNPMSNWIASFGPPPEITVDEVPATASSMTLALKAAVKGDPEETAKVQLFLNGKYMGNGTMNTTVTLQDGENNFEFKAVNRGGSSSEIITKKVVYNMPAPVVKHGAIPESTKNSSVTITATASDPNDPSPTIYINNQAVGQSSISYVLSLNTGDNSVEIKAGNKFGKMSEIIKKTVKYTSSK